MNNTYYDITIRNIITINNIFNVISIINYIFNVISVVINNNINTFL